MGITVYFVGETEAEAKANLPFLSYESAADRAWDYPSGTQSNVYSATAIVNFDSLELEMECA